MSKKPAVKKGNAPKVAESTAAEEPIDDSSSRAHFGLAAASMSQQEFAATQQSFCDQSIGERVALDIVGEIAEKAANEYIERTYNDLALDYCVLSLWDEMVLTVKSSFVQQDTGTKYQDSTATWEAGIAPAQTGCDVHSRHTIPVRNNGSSRPGTRGTPSVAGLTSSPSMAMGSSGLSKSGMAHRKSKMLDAPAGGSRAGSRPSSSEEPFRRSTIMQPSGRNSTMGNTKGGKSKQQDEKNDVSSNANEAVVEVELTADELAVLEEMKRRDESRKHILHVQKKIEDQLNDPKINQKGFVVDSNSGTVIPLLPIDDLLKKNIETTRFSVPEGVGLGSSQPPAPSTAPPGPRPGGVGGAQSARKPRSKEDNYFQPEEQGVAMVIQLNPSGGVGVKEDGGGTRKTELKAPKTKMTRDEYKRMVAQPMFADNTLDSDLAQEQKKRGNSAPVVNKPMPKDAEKKTAVTAVKPAREKEEPPAVVKDTTSGQTIKPQPMAPRPSPRPPSKGLAPKGPRSQRNIATPSERGSVRRAAKEHYSPTPQRKSRMVVTDNNALLEEEYYGEE